MRLVFLFAHRSYNGSFRSDELFICTVVLLYVFHKYNLMAKNAPKWPLRTTNGRSGPLFFVDAAHGQAALSRRCQVFYRGISSQPRK